MLDFFFVAKSGLTNCVYSKSQYCITEVKILVKQSLFRVVSLMLKPFFNLSSTPMSNARLVHKVAFPRYVLGKAWVKHHMPSKSKYYVR